MNEHDRILGDELVEQIKAYARQIARERVRVLRDARLWTQVREMIVRAGGDLRK